MAACDGRRRSEPGAAQAVQLQAGQRRGTGVQQLQLQPFPLAADRFIGAAQRLEPLGLPIRRPGAHQGQITPLDRVVIGVFVQAEHSEWVIAHAAVTLQAGRVAHRRRADCGRLSSAWAINAAQSCIICSSDRTSAIGESAINRGQHFDGQVAAEFLHHRADLVGRQDRPAAADVRHQFRHLSLAQGSRACARPGPAAQGAGLRRVRCSSFCTRLNMWKSCRFAGLLQHGEQLAFLHVGQVSRACLRHAPGSDRSGQYDRRAHAAARHWRSDAGCGIRADAASNAAMAWNSAGDQTMRLPFSRYGSMRRMAGATAFRLSRISFWPSMLTSARIVARSGSLRCAAVQLRLERLQTLLRPAHQAGFQRDVEPAEHAAAGVLHDGAQCVGRVRCPAPPSSQRAPGRSAAPRLARPAAPTRPLRPASCPRGRRGPSASACAHGRAAARSSAHAPQR